ERLPFRRLDGRQPACGRTVSKPIWELLNDSRFSFLRSKEEPGVEVGGAFRKYLFRTFAITPPVLRLVFAVPDADDPDINIGVEGFFEQQTRPPGMDAQCHHIYLLGNYPVVLQPDFQRVGRVVSPVAPHRWGGDHLDRVAWQSEALKQLRGNVGMRIVIRRGRQYAGDGPANGEDMSIPPCADVVRHLRHRVFWDPSLYNQNVRG